MDTATLAMKIRQLEKVNYQIAHTVELVRRAEPYPAMREEFEKEHTLLLADRDELRRGVEQALAALG